jgi:hypothetical protein
MLVSLKKRGLGILFITHDLSLGNYISDRTVILRAGDVVEMGITQKVFGNPQHSYTRSLLTAVPQLHRKWEHVDVDSMLAAPAAHAAPAEPDEDFEESKRYSKSSLHPRHRRGGSSGQVLDERYRAGMAESAARPGGDLLPDASGARPSLMDIPDAPWQRPGISRGEKLLLSQAPPELVECEEGHFVAAEG